MTRRTVPMLLVAVLLVAGLLAACSPEDSDDPEPAALPQPAPAGRLPGPVVDTLGVASFNVYRHLPRKDAMADASAADRRRAGRRHRLAGDQGGLLPGRTAPARPRGLGHLAALGAGRTVLAGGLVAARTLRPRRRLVDRGPRRCGQGAHRPAVPAPRLHRRHPAAPGERSAADRRRHPPQPGHRDRRRVPGHDQRGLREGSPAFARRRLGRGPGRPGGRHRRLQLRLPRRLHAPGPRAGSGTRSTVTPRRRTRSSAWTASSRRAAHAGSTTCGSPTARCG